MNQSVNNDLPLQYIKGIGPKKAKALAKSGIYSTNDLLMYIPRDYIFRESSLSLKELNNKITGFESIFNEETYKNVEYSVIVTIVTKELKQLRGRRQMLILTVTDESHFKAKITFFRGISYFKNYFKKDQKILVSGVPEVGKFGMQFVHPEIELLDSKQLKDYSVEGILPKYSLSSEMVKAGIRTKNLREIVKSVLPESISKVKETLDEYFLKKYKLPDIKTAIKNLHFPEDRKLLDRSIKRFKFEEIFLYELLLVTNRKNFKSSQKAFPMGQKLKYSKKLLDLLPFELTEDQKKASEYIHNELKKEHPLNTLLQGDVGAGKTIVAFIAMLISVDSGYQTLMMAPTEILAKQHYEKLTGYFGDKIKIELLIGGLKSKEKKETLEKIKSGETQIIIGTHALFQKKVEYNNLGLVVIDEQHRFGVEQRASLKQLGKESNKEGKVPHTLIMTATPIPRTLNMTAYGDLNVKKIKSKPKNRKEIVTKIRFDKNLPDIYDFMKSQIDDGRQAYIVYPLVEDSDKSEMKSAVEHYEKLSKNIFGNYKCGLLHGKLHWKEKDEIMKDFADKKYDILFSTTVIEVGIDVPNATVMLIENANRFGLSQLHQLRGRVGRGEHQSYCILLAPDKYQSYFKQNIDDIPTVKRLNALEKSNDGFELSEIDLELRGPGDILGTKQSGLPDFKFIDIVHDYKIIREARKMAKIIIEENKNIDSFPLLKEAFKKAQEKGVFVSTA